MLNMLKMDLYRMFRTRSLYVIWIVMFLLITATTYLGKMEYDSMLKESETQQESAAGEEAQQENAAGEETQQENAAGEEAQQENAAGPEAQQENMTEAGMEETENVNLGMSVALSVAPGEKVTVFDLFFANMQAKFVALFLVIFAVMFSTADLNSGYIKNIGGQLDRRGKLIFSRAAALLVFSVLTIGLFAVFQAFSNRIFFGYLEWGNAEAFLRYFCIQAVLNFALVIICMTIAVLLRNNVISMVIAVCLTMNVMVIFYNAADNLFEKLGMKDFHLIEYTVTGKIALLPMNPGARECMEALRTAAVFVIVLMVLSSLTFEKRDI